MNSIPASKLVAVIPGVLGTGGNPLALNAVFGSDSARIPIGTVYLAPGLQAVQDHFGVNSPEAALAQVYFGGFSNATRLPGRLYFAQYNAAPVAGYLRSGAFTGVPLTALQALSGALTVTIDGVVHTTAAINLATATSFTNAAALITAGLAAGAVPSTAICTYDAQLAEFVITSPTVGAASAVGFATGTLSAGLLFTAATGAVLSPGAVAATPAGFLNGVTAVTQNWATFTTTFHPDDATMLGFAAWVNGASPAGSERFAYVGETTDVTLTAGPAPTSWAALTANFNGRVAVYSRANVDTYGLQAAFVCGTAASINWAAINGRITFAFKGSSQISPTVTDLTAATNLEANGVNYYGAFATANTNFQLFQAGVISGQWDWIDEYIDQIYLNSQFQLALLSYAAGANSIPFNDDGYTQLRGSMRAPITEALRNGSIRKGVPLSPAQVQALIAASGVDGIGDTLTAQGWYLQILDPGAQARGNRTTPNMTFWYTDGGSIQQLSLASIDIQ